MKQKWASGIFGEAVLATIFLGFVLLSLPAFRAGVYGHERRSKDTRFQSRIKTDMQEEFLFRHGALR